jgi:hypothetical protein
MLQRSMTIHVRYRSPKKSRGVLGPFLSRKGLLFTPEVVAHVLARFYPEVGAAILGVSGIGMPLLSGVTYLHPGSSPIDGKNANQYGYFDFIVISLSVSKLLATGNP